MNKSKYISNRTSCQEPFEMTIKKYLLIAFLKNNCPQNVGKLQEKTC